jgi:hypothetical protein
MIYGVVMWIVTVYAFRRGGWEEKLASAGLVVASYLTVLLRSDSNPFHQLEGSVLALDMGHFLLMLVIVLLSRKFWPMWVAAMAAMSVIAHLLPYMPQSSPYLYFRAEALWSWPVWALIGVAVWRHSARRSKKPVGPS